jgi:hypothetical protein
MKFTGIYVGGGNHGLVDSHETPDGIPFYTTITEIMGEGVEVTYNYAPVTIKVSHVSYHCFIVDDGAPEAQQYILAVRALLDASARDRAAVTCPGMDNCMLTSSPESV